jgi:septal ring factor EnvC (AmiA/AmiB activator)
LAGPPAGQPRWAAFRAQGEPPGSQTQQPRWDGPSDAPDRAQLARLSQRAAERIKALQREAQQLAARERTLLNELRALEVERQLKAAELDQVAREVEETTSELAEKTTRIEELEHMATAQRPGVEARLVELYKLGRPRYARLLLGVEDLRTITRAYRTVTALAELDRQRIEEHRRMLESLRAARTELQSRHARLTAAQAQARTARRALDRAVAAQTNAIEGIDRRRDLTAELTGELQLAYQQLEASLAALSEGAAATPLPIALPLRPFRGDLEPPVTGRITATFGKQQQTRFGTTILRNGIEIAAPEGLPVEAVHDGEVAFADTFTGFGNLVILDHGGQSYSLYGYLSSLTLQRGARVDRHQVLGTVGRTPAGVPALYFELRIDGKPVDPVQWLRPGS